MSVKVLSDLISVLHAACRVKSSNQYEGQNSFSPPVRHSLQECDSPEDTENTEEPKSTKAISFTEVFTKALNESVGKIKVKSYNILKNMSILDFLFPKIFSGIS